MNLDSKDTEETYFKISLSELSLKVADRMHPSITGTLPKIPYTISQDTVDEGKSKYCV